MDKNTILAMEGNKLRAEVAQRIMGIKVEYPFAEGYPYYLREDKDGKMKWDIVPGYHRDISAAWQVVEKMRSMEDGEGNSLLCCLTIYSDHDLVWDIRWCYSEFSNRNDGHKTHCLPTCYDDFPEAICKAALIAKLEGGHDTA
ncbi:hypothetical protein ES703_64138 [subsurface metagenome]